MYTSCLCKNIGSYNRFVYRYGKGRKTLVTIGFYAPTLEGLKSLRHAAQPRFWGLVGHALYSPGPGVLCLEGGPKRLALPKPQERAERRSDCTCDPTELLRL